jgi:L-alanine-DL-glutamate epimerase-like enolase superfamily enzyme
VKLAVEPVCARLRAPFAAAWGTIGEREILVVRLEAADGIVGWGEAAPLPGYGGAGLEEVRAALDRYAGVLAAAADAPRADLLAACTAASDVPEALAAVDLALWDIDGRRCRKPLCELLAREGLNITGNISGEYPNDLEVVVNATVAAEDPGSVSTRVAVARWEGFRCVKVKVAVGNDSARLAAARSAGGEEMAIRIDANGGWSLDQAVAKLETLAEFRVEMCEEPVHGLDQVARVAAESPIPIALDETAVAPGAFERRVCDAVCLKVARSGGLTGLLQSAAQASAAGYRIYLASTLDGPLAVASALHAAVAIRPELPCGLATLGVFADRVDPLPARGGRISVPAGPGLGDGLREWYGL